jgi:hypothetical protein
VFQHLTANMSREGADGLFADSGILGQPRNEGVPQITPAVAHTSPLTSLKPGQPLRTHWPLQVQVVYSHRAGIAANADLIARKDEGFRPSIWEPGQPQTEAGAGTTREGNRAASPRRNLALWDTTSPLVMFPLANVSLKSRCLNTRTSEERIPVSSVIRSNGRRAGERLALAAAMSFDSSSALTARPTSWRSGKARTRSAIGPQSPNWRRMPRNAPTLRSKLAGPHRCSGEFWSPSVRAFPLRMVN